MTKGDDGIWSITTGPILPDFYDYAFNVDGVHTLDPGNLSMKPDSTPCLVTKIGPLSC